MAITSFLIILPSTQRLVYRIDVPSEYEDSDRDAYIYEQLKKYEAIQQVLCTYQNRDEEYNFESLCIEVNKLRSELNELAAKFDKKNETQSNPSSYAG